MLLVGPVERIYSVVTIELPLDRQQRRPRQVVGLRIALSQAASQFGLVTEHKDGVRIARSTLGTAWAGVEDAHAVKLRLYAEVHPDLGSVLDPVIDEFVTRALEVLAVLGEEAPHLDYAPGAR